MAARGLEHVSAPLRMLVLSPPPMKQEPRARELVGREGDGFIEGQHPCAGLGDIQQVLDVRKVLEDGLRL